MGGTIIDLYTVAGVYLAGPDAARFEGAWRFTPEGAGPPHGAEVGTHNATLTFDVAGSALDLGQIRVAIPGD